MIVLSILFGIAVAVIGLSFLKARRLHKEVSEMSKEVLAHLEVLEAKKPLPKRLAEMRESLQSGRYK